MRSGLLLSSMFALFVTLSNGAAIGTIASQNDALTSQAGPIDDAVVALTAQTSPTQAQAIPSALQSLTNSISAALASSSPITPTSDPNIEATIFESWGTFANNIEELMADFVIQHDLLVTTFGLGGSMHDQLESFNTSFVNFGAFMLTTVGDAASQATIKQETGNTYGDPIKFQTLKTGILWALFNFPATS